MSKMFKWWLAIGFILNLIGWPLLWNPNIDIISHLLIGAGLNCVYLLFGLMAELGEQILRL